MAVDWGKMAKSVLNGETWEESVGIWKISNILGWYMSNYGAIKTQLMLGFERKINMLYKYEWYLTQPTKVLVNGEGKVDLNNTKKVTPSLGWRTLFTTTESATRDQKSAENSLKSANSSETVAATKTESYGTHTMNVQIGSSVEDIAVNKEISALGGKIQLVSGVQGVTAQSGGGRVQVLPTAVTVSAPVINLG